MRLTISELLASRTCSLTGQGWRPIHHQALGQTVLLADQRGAQAKLRCGPGATGLWLLRHAWSGTVKISVGSDSRRIPLTSQVQDLDFVVPLDPSGSTDADIEITVDCDERTPKSHAQVWLLGLTFDTLPLPTIKVETISASTRLISGEWGRFLVLLADSEIPVSILNAGVWAPRDVEVFKTHIRPGDCVLDIGAHVGHHSVVLSKLVGPSGKVLSVEAQRVMFQLLNANCVINGAFNVQSAHMAASDHRHVVRLYPIRVAQNNLGSLGVNENCRVPSEDEQGELVDAGCVDHLVEQYFGARRVAFIKVDVQAYEKYALLGLMRTIANDRPKILFEVAPYWMKRAGYDYRDIYELLMPLGYQFEHFIELPLTSSGIPDVPLGCRSEWDTLAVASKG